MNLKWFFFKTKWKSKKFTAWLKEKFPNKDLHHAYTLKKLDLFQVPRDHEYHLGKIHGKGVKEDFRDDIIKVLVAFIMENCDEWKDE